MYKSAYRGGWRGYESNAQSRARERDPNPEIPMTPPRCSTAARGIPSRSLAKTNPTPKLRPITHIRSNLSAITKQGYFTGLGHIAILRRDGRREKPCQHSRYSIYLVLLRGREGIDAMQAKRSVQQPRYYVCNLCHDDSAARENHAWLN